MNGSYPFINPIGAEIFFFFFAKNVIFLFYIENTMISRPSVGKKVAEKLRDFLKGRWRPLG